MAKKKITLYIDESVAKAAKVSAIATKCTESVLVERAILSYLDTKDIKAAKADLIKLLDELKLTPKKEFSIINRVSSIDAI